MATERGADHNNKHTRMDVTFLSNMIDIKSFPSASEPKENPICSKQKKHKRTRNPFDWRSIEAVANWKNKAVREPPYITALSYCGV